MSSPVADTAPLKALVADLLEQAKALGNALARTEEYQALRRALKDADGDGDISAARKELERLARHD